MAKSKRKGKKLKPWTSQEEDRLIANVEKHVLCLQKAFEQTSKEIQRSPKAVAGHWYNRTSKHVAVNRKNSKGQPLKLSLYKRLLNILHLSY